MTKGGKKNKRGVRGSIEDDDTTDAKRPNMADSNGVFFSIKTDVIQYSRNLIDDETGES